MDSIAKQIVKFVTNPIGFVDDSSKHVKFFFKDVLLSSLSSCALFIISGMLLMFLPYYEKNNYRRINQTDKQIHILEKRINSNDVKIEILTKGFHSVISRMKGSGFNKSGEKESSNHDYSRTFQPPILLFAKIKASGGENPLKSITFGLSLSGFSNNAQTPIITLRKNCIKGSLVFDSYKSLGYLLQNKENTQTRLFKLNTENNLLPDSVSIKPSLITYRGLDFSSFFGNRDTTNDTRDNANNNNNSVDNIVNMLRNTNLTTNSDGNNIQAEEGEDTSSEDVTDTNDTRENNNPIIPPPPPLPRFNSSPAFNEYRNPITNISSTTESTTIPNASTPSPVNQSNNRSVNADDHISTRNFGKAIMSSFYLRFDIGNFFFIKIH